MDEMQILLDNTAEAARRAAELDDLLALPETAADSRYYTHLVRERARIAPWAEAHNGLQRAMAALAENRRLQASEDKDLLPLLREEETALSAAVAQAADAARALSGQMANGGTDPCQMTVRDSSGHGFAGEIVHMYARYLDAMGLEYTLAEQANGGTLSVTHGGYGKLRYEAGMHKRTDGASATVTVMPVRPEGKVVVSPEEIRVDIYMSSGKGGQNVNKVETAVRITHLPTGMVVTCQDERSQLMNKRRALATLTTRLQQQQDHDTAAARVRERDAQIQDRSNAVRRYDPTRNELRDLRTHVSVPLKKALKGDIDPLVQAINLSMLA